MSCCQRARLSAWKCAILVRGSGQLGPGRAAGLGMGGAGLDSSYTVSDLVYDEPASC